MELEHQKAKLEYKSAIDSLTHRIKSKDIELSKLQMENTHLKEVTANSLLKMLLSLRVPTKLFQHT